MTDKSFYKVEDSFTRWKLELLSKDVPTSTFGVSSAHLFDRSTFHTLTLGVSTHLFVLLVVMLHLKAVPSKVTSTISTAFVRKMSDKPDSKKDFVMSLAPFTLILGGLCTGLGGATLYFNPIIDEWCDEYNLLLHQCNTVIEPSTQAKGSM